jgi:two-component system sensor histidine kinase DesK
MATHLHGMTRRERRARSVVGLIWIVLWMVALLGPVDAVRHGDVSPVLPTGLTLAAFVLLYLLVTWSSFNYYGRLPLRLSGLVVVAVLGTVLATVEAHAPGSWLILMLYVGVCAGASLPPRLAFPGVVVIAAVALAIGMGRHVSGGEYGSVAFSTVMAGALIVVVRRMSALIGELRKTREQLAHAAVAEERLRFARDLHDLLGHTLSLIVVKAEVARRLSASDPAAAAEQTADIERIGREALVEVREAVTGYRERGLTAELDHARGALADAGIDATVRTAGLPLPVQVDALLAWAVREGVTNVIRHSRARTCRIEVHRRDGRAVAEVVDDGVGAAGSVAVNGNGLRGLTERMAAVGGALAAGDTPGGGYRLAVDIPIDPELAVPA